MDILGVKQKFGIIGNDELVNRAIEVSLRVASTDLTVLITGESGVGKEFFPKIIHENSPRKFSKYIAVNCGAIPEGTIDSELFGHEKGAFTGAIESRKGYFEEANGGTIFLDEVGELPLSTQVRLLRVLQTGEIIRVGASKPMKVNVRVVAATNSDLLRAISDGRFREDLYYRLNTVPISIPPLRERREDISLLFRKFATDVADRYRMPKVTLDTEALAVLKNYDWPGNVRQLKNVAEQISAVEEARQISAEILMAYLPNYQRSYVPVLHSEHTAATNSDRELLYKILFEMRSEMNDMKSMLIELLQRNGNYEQPRVIQPQALLPSVINHNAQPNNSHEFIESQEITEEQTAKPQTKDEAEREAIINALKRNGGRRKMAAQELFISERTLYRKIKELNINDNEY
ncbi:MAG: sigma-54-dependent Fis family transcriptional regulator [Rikenellaceae bacterium]|nr:sigma-54-dependent Fis family transcriptional regulator [Rikenellaceae bacterium]